MQIRGAAFGIGGHVKFAFGTPTDMLRIGAEGHSSNVRYAPSPSYAHTGWGGVLVDYIRRTKGRVHPFIGCLIGGGGVKNHIIAQGGTVLKADWLLNATSRQNDFSSGPRLYVGILFNRLQH